ncbi:DUF2092 domain-containing protein [Desulfoferrobacter suflitae]|uniref:DUF2092 domain-containing protein n=1 Tax=Desulfoferrobacter suflitae TaxID=2865782 RepID=UPI0021648385|nr:DUF2092 domain-containing protein [Desulfoferrobacter suflitae]MCK8602935.1 DUF2092 domain-containing protein [Desulfoferrobacter suflitae]
MTLTKLVLLMVLLVCLAAVPGLAAQQQVSGDSGSQTEAMALLMKTGEFISQTKQLSVAIRAGYDVLQENGQMIEFGELRKLTLVRPDHFRMESERSDGEKVLVLFDGKHITVFSPDENVFARAAKTGDVDQAVRHLLSDLQLRLPLAMLFVTQLPRELERRVRAIEIVEENTLMDVPCVHLAARTDQVDFQIWIPAKGDPLPRRIVITYKHEEGRPQFWANLSEWNLSLSTPPGFFVFTPPEKAQQIPFLAELQLAKPDAGVGKEGDEQ